MTGGDDLKKVILTIDHIKQTIKEKNFHLASTLLLKCSEYYFVDAKEKTGHHKQISLEKARSFLDLYDQCQRVILEQKQEVIDLTRIEVLSFDTKHIDKVDMEIDESDLVKPTSDSNHEEMIEIKKEFTSLRPYHLKDYIGQDSIKERLVILIQAAKQRDDALDHIFLYGSAGLGKTSLAQIISHEMDAHFIELNATTLNDVQSFAHVVKSLEHKDVLFIDEVHALSSMISDMLLTVLEDYRISYIQGKGASAKVISEDIKRFTFIGATTHPGLLSKPLLDRMIHKFKMERYTNEELQMLVKLSFSKWHLNITDDAALEIAKRSRSIPRIANNFVRLFRDLAQIQSLDELSSDFIKEYFVKQEIDDEGITNEDRMVLSTLIDRFQGGPVSLMSLASVIGDNENIIEYHIEPYLIQKGFITIKKTGRVCTELGYAYISGYCQKGAIVDESK